MGNPLDEARHALAEGRELEAIAQALIDIAESLRGGPDLIEDCDRPLYRVADQLHDLALSVEEAVGGHRYRTGHA